MSAVSSDVTRLVSYIKANAHRVIAYAVAEGTAIFGIAHTQATVLEHEIAVAGAAAIAALVNKVRAL